MVAASFYQTDIGLIPKGWKPYKVGELVSFSGGSQPDKNHFRNRASNGYVRLIQIRDYKSDRHETYIPESLARKFCDEKDVMIGRYGPPIFQILRGIKGAYNVALIKASPAPELNREFFYHFIKNENLFSLMEALSRRSSGQTGVELPALREYPLPLPDLNEQKAIAKALTDVDELIISLEKLIAKKRDIKTATMQQLLTGKKRLAGFGEGKGYKQTELGEIPEDWDVKTYDEIFSFYTTASNSRDDLSENGSISYIHYGDIHTKWDITLDMAVTNLPKIARHKFKGAAFIKDGDVVMADASEDYEGIGKSIEISGVGDAKAIAGLHTFLLRDNDGTYVDGFRGYLHVITAVKASFDRLATGLKVYGLSKNSLKAVFIPVPPKKEQEKIVEILAGMTAEVDSLVCRLSKTKSIKQGMMQELLTGRTRLI